MLPTVGHPHRPRWHQWGVGLLSGVQRQFQHINGSHSSRWLLAITAHSIHLLHVFSNGLLDCKHSHIGYIMIFVGVFLLQPLVCGNFLPKAWTPDSRAGGLALIHRPTFVWLFSTVCLQMCSQVACLIASIVTLVAFVRFFSTVYFQMCPQIFCLIRSKVTLLAFVWLFSTLRFQMGPQIHYPRRCISHVGCIY